MVESAAVLTLPTAATQRRRRWNLLRLLRRYPLGVVGGLVLVMLALVAIFAPAIAPYSPTAPAFGILQQPSAAHLFGTDRTGRDVVSRVVYGSRPSLEIGVVAATLAALVSTSLGMLAGYYQRWPDYLIQRTGEVLAMIPGLILLFLWVAAFGPGFLTLLAALAVTTAFDGVRIVRGVVLTEKHASYVEAARSVGASDRRILAQHLLPNVLPIVLVSYSLRVPVVILAEASLSFLGLGIPPPTASWGADLGGTAQTFFHNQPWLAVAPGVALSLTVLGFLLVGDALRNALDPRLRHR